MGGKGRGVHSPRGTPGATCRPPAGASAGDPEAEPPRLWRGDSFTPEEETRSERAPGAQRWLLESVFSGHGARSPTLRHLRLCCAVKFWLPGPPHPFPDSSASQPGRCRTCGTLVPAVGTPGRIMPCAGERQCLAIPVRGPSASPWTAEGGRTVVAQPCAWARPLWGEAGRHSLHQGPSWQPVPSLGHAGGSLGARPGLGAAGSCNVERGPVVQ